MPGRVALVTDGLSQFELTAELCGPFMGSQIWVEPVPIPKLGDDRYPGCQCKSGYRVDIGLLPRKLQTLARKKRAGRVAEFVVCTCVGKLIE